MSRAIDDLLAILNFNSLSTICFAAAVHRSAGSGCSAAK